MGTCISSLLQNVGTSHTYPNVIKGGFAGDVIQKQQRFGDRSNKEGKLIYSPDSAHLCNSNFSVRLTVCISVICMCHTSEPFLSCRVPNLKQKKENKLHMVPWPGSTWLALIFSYNTGA